MNLLFKFLLRLLELTAALMLSLGFLISFFSCRRDDDLSSIERIERAERQSS